MEIIYEDNHLIAVNKKISDIVQRDKSGDLSLEDEIKEYLKIKYNKSGNAFLGVVHRIDRPVSGVVLFAKTSKALERMNNLFQLKKVNKIYWAIVKNKPPKDSDVLTHYILRNQQQNKSYAYDYEVKESKLAQLEYKIIGTSKNYYLLEINLFTGRHHQIRCQLAKINCPIKGDLKYGFARSNKNGGISLHSRKLSFLHPVANIPIDIIAKPPENDIWNEFNI
jgi:23S rRNA pseudouridine1911/1915/1917 synthase